SGATDFPNADQLRMSDRGLLIHDDVESDWREAGGGPGLVAEYGSSVFQLFGIRTSTRRVSVGGGASGTLVTGEIDARRYQEVRAAVWERTGGNADFFDFELFDAWVEAATSVAEMLRENPSAGYIDVRRSGPECQVACWTSIGGEVLVN